MRNKRESGFTGIILLLGFSVLFGVSYFVLSKTGLPKSNLFKGATLHPETTPYESAYGQTYPTGPEPNVPTNTVLLPTFPPITPFVLEPLTITLTDTQFTQLANTYKPESLPVGDITFTFSDNTITATTIATAQTVQGPIKIVAIHENKWFTITKVYLGTFELPTDLTLQINSLVNDNFKQVLASLYLDGLQIESIKGHTMKLSLNAPPGLIQKEGSGVSLDKRVIGQ